jgi:malate dehydrogenase (oxaloacetate-decarboxylating)(NADP+)
MCILNSHITRRLLGEDSHELSAEQSVFARSQDGGMPLLDVCKKYKPTILLGVTAAGGLFTEELVRTMADNCQQPIIFPLSNPTIKAECSAEQAYQWTDGRCIFASGSPFEPVTLSDGRTFTPSQCNNMYIFPGVGLGATVCGATKISDRMLYVAACALANFVSDYDIEQGKVFPSIQKIREASHAIACAVVREAKLEGLTTKVLPDSDGLELEDHVATKMYFPEYVPLVESRRVTI